MAEPQAPKMIKIWRIRVACWIKRVTRVNVNAYAHASEHPHARTQTRRQICNSYCFSTTMIRNLASMLRYTYSSCLTITVVECVYCAVGAETLYYNLHEVRSLNS
jgi:hypothetical protein